MNSQAPSRLERKTRAVPVDPVQAMRRVALAAAQPGGPELLPALLQELADGLQAAMVFAAVFSDDLRTTVRTLSVSLDGEIRPNFGFALKGIGRAALARRAFHWVRSGLLPRMEPDCPLAKAGMDAIAACPLTDSAGEPLGILVAMDRKP